MLQEIKNRIRAKYVDKKHLFILHLFLIFVVVWTRFVFLGYSDYQGDEIKAMYRLAPGQTMVEFLLEQRKGPIQFFITAAIEPFTNDYYNAFVLRLPFAIAGALAVLFFYKFVKLHFNRTIASYAALFMALNGFFIGFSRIVQYQSFTILFFVMALYYFSKALFDQKFVFRGWYIGAFWWGLSALSHYDAIFIAPFVIYIFVLWYRQYTQYSSKKKLLNIAGGALVTLAVLGIFYVPFFLSLTENQLNYWFGRLSDGTGKISSSKYLFELYNPIFILEIYLVLLALSFLKVRSILPYLLWAAFPLLFMEVLTDVPGTHIYTYILPLIVVISLGLSVVKSFTTTIFEKQSARLFSIFITLVFITNFLISHTIFIDHSIEYPWSNKKFLFWDIARPNAMYHLSVFGFPYYRHWEEIEDYVRENNLNGVFGTNERKSIPRFYLEDFDKEGATATQYIYIDNPQSFSEDILQNKPYYWIRILKKSPDTVYKNGDEVVARIYNMPEGTLTELEGQGWK